ncbi:MAG: hypothetical protein NNA22_10930 [Nitrospira sp.]|nr:hypothetical protein [Nitrospira sp.]
MHMQIRRLTEAGITEFGRYLDGLRNGDLKQPPVELLDNPNFSEPAPAESTVENISFASRFEMGRYLVDRLAEWNQQALAHDVGTWSWLALFYFDTLCPAGKLGARAVRENYTYILSRRYNHQPRHALRTTFLFAKKYGDTVRFMFSRKPHERGEIVEQLAAYQYLSGCRGVIEAAAALYDDPLRGAYKRGAAGKGPGSARRLVAILRQLDLTYDLYALSGREIVNMLPREFDRFRPSQADATRA